MDSKALAEYLDQNRWLLNNGLVNDGVKNQLFLYGSIVHKDVRAVEVNIEVATKVIDYKIYVDKDLIRKIGQYEVLSKSTGIFGMWQFKRLLKKEGNLNLLHILNQFVRDYCGPKWSANLQVLDIKSYVEGYKEKSELGTMLPDQQVD